MQNVTSLLMNSQHLFLLVETNAYSVRLMSSGLSDFLGMSSELVLEKPLEYVLPGLTEALINQKDSHLKDFFTEILCQSEIKKPVVVNAEQMNQNNESLWFMVLRDAEQELEAKSKAREIRHMMRAILDNTLDGIITINDRGTVINFNRAAEVIFGYSEEEVLGKNVNIFMPNPFHSEHDNYLQNYLNTGNPKIIGKGREVLGLTKTGQTFPFYLSIGPDIQIGERRYFTGLVRDLSRERMIQEQLRQAQKMEAIGTMAGGIAHDFNNILGGIMGYVELMLEEAPEGSYFREDLIEMLKACNRAKALVQQILTFSRKDKPKRDTVHLDLLVKESLKLLRASIPTIIEIRSRVQSGMSVEADPTQMHQVIMNLCTNAYHAMRESGGSMEIVLDDIQIDEEYYLNSIRKLVRGRYVRLSVTDEGHGMDAATIARIFEPFFTTKPHGEGTGMGLSVVHGIVAHHGGEIFVQSELGLGTKFEVLLPFKAPQKLELPKGEVEVAKGRERMMVVDDDEALLRVLMRIISSAGYQVSAYASSTEAWAAFSSDPQGFDLVVTDQTMPKMTGMDLAKRMLALRPELPIILATGFTDMITPESSKQIGIKEFMQKPIEMKVLIKKFRELLDK